MTTTVHTGAAHLDDARARLAARQSAAIALVLLLTTALYYPTLARLVAYWAANDVYSYAFIVPVISAGFVWIKRQELRAARIEPSLIAGGIVLASGLAILLAGRLSSTNLIEEASIIPTSAGLVLLLFGADVFRIVSFSIAYLCAMIPMWDRLTTAAHPVFQHYSAAVGVAVVRLLGVPVLKDGVRIDLPNISLEVAQACSGVNYLIAVLCIGLPVAQLFVRHWPKRALIVFASVAIALLSNGLRVAIVSLFAYYGVRGANGDVHGPFALFRSLLISGVGLAAVIGLTIRFADGEQTAPARAAVKRAVPPAARRVSVAVLVAVFLLLSCSAYLATHRVTPVSPGAGFLSVPTTINGWDLRSTPSVLSDLDPQIFDDHVIRNYAAPDGTEANLFVGYYRTQEQGRELAGYALRQALTGWDHATFALPGGESVKDFIVISGGEPFHVSYWYVLDGRIVTDDLRAKLDSAWRSLAARRTNGAVVVVKTAARPGDSVTAARQRDGEFVAGALAASKALVAP